MVSRRIDLIHENITKKYKQNFQHFEPPLLTSNYSKYFTCSGAVHFNSV